MPARDPLDPGPLDDRPTDPAADPAAEAFPRWLAPMLATPAAAVPTGPGWCFEPKLDGYRCLAFCRGDEVALRSRNEQSFDERFAGIGAALAGWGVGAAVFDGELVAFADGRPSFLALQRIAEPDAGPAPTSLTYVIFDVLHLHGRSTRRLPLRERRSLLDALPAPPPGIGMNPVVDGDGTELLALLCAQGWEGIVAKQAASPYVGRRSPSWQKVKCTLRQELVVCGFTEPKGSRTGFGALVLGYHDGADLVFAGKLGTGFDARTIAALDPHLRALETPGPSLTRDVPREAGLHWVEPVLVVEVGFTEWPAGGHLRHPRFLGIRPDKSAAEVVRELP